MKTLIITMMLLCLGISNSYSLVLHVPLEYPTIQDGITAAVDGDTVLVAPGEYTGTGNNSISFLGKAILVTSEKGPDSTFIGDNPWNGFMREPNETHPLQGAVGFIFENNETYSSILKGFSITYKSAHAVYIQNSSPLIKNCKMLWNGDPFFAPEGAVFLEYSSPVIINSEISYNSGYGDAGIVCISSDPIILNTIFYGNWTTMFYAGVMDIMGGNPILINCTIFNNTYGIEGDGATLRNCIYWYNAPIGGSLHDLAYTDYDYYWPGEGNISEDPLFVDPYYPPDLRLQPDSPCIDAGDPDSPNVPWGGWRRDMGAYEFDQGFFFNGQDLILKPFPIELPIK